MNIHAKNLVHGFLLFSFYHDVALLFKIPNLCKDKRPELVKPFIVCYLQGSYEYPCLKYIFSFGHDQANYGWAWIAQWACESHTGVSTRVQFWQDGQNKQTSGDLRIYITHVTRMYLPTKCNVSYCSLQWICTTEITIMKWRNEKQIKHGFDKLYIWTCT